MFYLKIFLFLLFFSSVAVSARNLSTLGSPGSGALYACSVAKEDIVTLDVDSTGTYRTKEGFTTYCRRVIDQHMLAKPSIVAKYTVNQSDLFTIVARFFWYRPDHISQGSAALEFYCKSHLDHFKDCQWTKNPKVNPLPMSTVSSLPDNMKGLIEAHKSEDLTKGSVYGCAVILCLANPNGWSSVAQCKPPVKKLFRDLAKGKGWPNCSSETKK